MSISESKLLSYISLTPHLRVLRFYGVLPLDPASPKPKKKLHGFYMRINVSLMMLYTALQIIYIYQVRDDLDKVMDSMFLLLTFLDCIVKHIIFNKNPHKILKLLDIMKGPSFNQGLEEHRPVLMRTIYQARFLLYLFNTLCVVLCFLWMVMPLILHLKQELVEFAIWLPFEANEDPIFYIVVFYAWIETTWLGLNNSSMDIFVVYLFAQIKTQVSILRMDLKNLVGKCREEATTTSQSLTEVFEYRFKGILRHYNQIIEYTFWGATNRPQDISGNSPIDKMYQKLLYFPPSAIPDKSKMVQQISMFSKINEDVFHGPIFFQFLVSGWIICASAYRTMSMNLVSGEFLSMTIYIFCILSELFLYCFFGNGVEHESQRITESAYSMEWEELPVKDRRKLIIFMERIKRPIQLKAGKIVPLSNNTFLQIIKTSYTYYTLLSNLKEE